MELRGGVVSSNKQSRAGHSCQEKSKKGETSMSCADSSHVKESGLPGRHSANSSASSGQLDPALGAQMFFCCREEDSSRQGLCECICTSPSEKIKCYFQYCWWPGGNSSVSSNGASAGVNIVRISLLGDRTLQDFRRESAATLGITFQ